MPWAWAMPHMIAGVTAPPRWQCSSARDSFRESWRAIPAGYPPARRTGARRSLAGLLVTARGWSADREVRDHVGSDERDDAEPALRRVEPGPRPRHGGGVAERRRRRHRIGGQDEVAGIRRRHHEVG